jgi:hypothetical protein
MIVSVIINKLLSKQFHIIVNIVQIKVQFCKDFNLTNQFYTNVKIIDFVLEILSDSYLVRRYNRNQLLNFLIS